MVKEFHQRWFLIKIQLEFFISLWNGTEVTKAIWN